jgi:biopolymer transport protein ExbD
MRLTAARPSRLDPTGIRLPLIALIDVVLFLLFYFVISYSVAAEESELATGFARPGQSSSALEPQVVMVSQTAAGAEYRIGTHRFAERAGLVAFLRTLPKEAGVVVKATPETPVEITVGAVQAGKDAGFANVRFAVGGDEAAGAGAR